MHKLSSPKKSSTTKGEAWKRGWEKKKKLGFTAQKTVPTWKVGEQPVTAERETIDEKKKKVKEH